MSCLRVVLCLMLLNACGPETPTVKQPKDFKKKLRVEAVSDSVMAWACATAKDLGVKSLKNQFPELKVSRKSTWLLKPKEVYFAEHTDVLLRRWFFYFLSDDGYFIRFVVDDDKQVSGLDTGCNVKVE